MSTEIMENKQISQLASELVAYKWGGFSWCYDSRFEGKPGIAVQYLRFQGAEFHLVFSKQSDADLCLQKLFRHFKPKDEPTTVQGHGWSKLDYGFTVATCFNPVLMLKLARQITSEVELVFHPKKYEIGEMWFGKSWQKLLDANRVTRHPDNPFKWYYFIVYQDEMQSSYLLQSNLDA